MFMTHRGNDLNIFYFLLQIKFKQSVLILKLFTFYFQQNQILDKFVYFKDGLCFYFKTQKKMIEMLLSESNNN